jgi:hypothetical protein
MPEDNELEFELTDILESVTSPQMLKQVVTENIEYLLKREHKRGYVKYPRGYSVVIPEGGYTTHAETPNESGSFEGDFEVFSDPNTIDRYGHVLGTLSAYELIDITVWFKNDKPLEVTLKWIRNSKTDLAKQLRHAISLTPSNECAICEDFFNDFSSLNEDIIDHFQQIIESSDARVKHILIDTPLVKIVRLA